MKNVLWQNFEEYALPSQQTHAIRGGGTYLNQQIFAHLCEETNYKIPLLEWEHADYRYWAHQVGVSINTLKAWIHEGANPRINAQKRLSELLRCKNWAELEQNIILKKT
jgi:hypothetical protein